MPTTLVWNQTVAGVADKQTATVQADNTNPAFTLTKSGAVWVLDSHITGKENRGGTFASEALAKTYADTVLVEENVPQHGTETVN